MIRSSFPAVATEAAASSFHILLSQLLRPQRRAFVRWRWRSPVGRRSRWRRSPRSPLLYDSYAVTAARGSQPIADVLADITVIGAAEIARAGAQSLTELLQRQPGVEITQNGGPGSLSGIFLRGANRGPDAGADRRHPDRVVERGRDIARSDPARPDRPDRDPARTSVEPLRRGRDRRRRAGVHAARNGRADGQCERGLRHLRHLGRQGWRRRNERAGDVRGAGSGEGEQRLQRLRRPGEVRVQPRQGWLQEPEHLGQRRIHRRAGTGIHRRSISGATSTASSTAERASTIGRSPWPKPGRSRRATTLASVLGVEAVGGRRDRRQRVRRPPSAISPSRRRSGSTLGRTNSRCLSGMLTAGFERREEHLATDRRIRGRPSATRIRCSASTSCASTTMRCRGICAGTIRASTAARRQAPSPTAIASPRRCASPRATPRASRRRRSTTSISPDSRNPDLVPETSQEPRGGRLLERQRRRRASVEARAIVYRNRVSQLIIFQCDVDFNLRAAQRESRDARRRDARPGSPRRQRRDAHGVARHPVTGGRRHRQAPAAAGAPAWRVDGGLSGGTRAARRGAHRLVVALRGSGQLS